MKKAGRPMCHGDYFPQELRDLLKLMDACSDRRECKTCGERAECERLYQKIGYSGKVKPKIKEDIESLLRVA